MSNNDQTWLQRELERRKQQAKNQATQDPWTGARERRRVLPEEQGKPLTPAPGSPAAAALTANQQSFVAKVEQARNAGRQQISPSPSRSGKRGRRPGR